MTFVFSIDFFFLKCLYPLLSLKSTSICLLKVFNALKGNVMSVHTLVQKFSAVFTSCNIHLNQLRAAYDHLITPDLVWIYMKTNKNGDEFVSPMYSFCCDMKIKRFVFHKNVKKFSKITFFTKSLAANVTENISRQCLFLSFLHRKKALCIMVKLSCTRVVNTEAQQKQIHLLQEGKLGGGGL